MLTKLATIGPTGPLSDTMPPFSGFHRDQHRHPLRYQPPIANLLALCEYRLGGSSCQRPRRSTDADASNSPRSNVGVMQREISG